LAEIFYFFGFFIAKGWLLRVNRDGQSFQNFSNQVNSLHFARLALYLDNIGCGSEKQFQTSLIVFRSAYAIFG